MLCGRGCRVGLYGGDESRFADVDIGADAAADADWWAARLTVAAGASLHPTITLPRMARILVSLVVVLGCRVVGDGDGPVPVLRGRLSSYSGHRSPDLDMKKPRLLRGIVVFSCAASYAASCRTLLTACSPVGSAYVMKRDVGVTEYLTTLLGCEF